MKWESQNQLVLPDLGSFEKPGEEGEEAVREGTYPAWDLGSTFTTNRLLMAGHAAAHAL